MIFSVYLIVLFTREIKQLLIVYLPCVVIATFPVLPTSVSQSSKLFLFVGTYVFTINDIFNKTINSNITTLTKNRYVLRINNKMAEIIIRLAHYLTFNDFNNKQDVVCVLISPNFI